MAINLFETEQKERKSNCWKYHITQTFSSKTTRVRWKFTSDHTKQNKHNPGNIGNFLTFNECIFFKDTSSFPQRIGRVSTQKSVMNADVITNQAAPIQNIKTAHCLIPPSCALLRLSFCHIFTNMRPPRQYLAGECVTHKNCRTPFDFVDTAPDSGTTHSYLLPLPPRWNQWAGRITVVSKTSKYMKRKTRHGYKLANTKWTNITLKTCNT